MIWTAYVIVVLLAVSGLARAARTSCSDYKADSMFAWWFRSDPMLIAKLAGGPQFNQRFIWTADFWHAMVLIEKITWRFAGALLFFANVETVIGFVLLGGAVEGRFFVLGYHYLFVADTTLEAYWSLNRIVLGTVLFWKNENLMSND